MPSILKTALVPHPLDGVAGLAPAAASFVVGNATSLVNGSASAFLNLGEASTLFSTVVSEEVVDAVHSSWWENARAMRAAVALTGLEGAGGVHRGVHSTHALSPLPLSALTDPMSPWALIVVAIIATTALVIDLLILREGTPVHAHVNKIALANRKSEGARKWIVVLMPSVAGFLGDCYFSM